MNVIISGGSRGLGAALAERLLVEGNRVATFARSPSDYTERLSEKFDDRFLFRPLDAIDTKAVSAFVREVDQQFEELRL